MLRLKKRKSMSALTLGQAIRNLKRINLQKLQSETARIIKSDPNLVFRKQDEFRQGENPDGSVIGYYRSSEYQLMKQQQNPLAGGTVDLILTGSTIKHLQVVYLGDGIYELYSTDAKWLSLVEKYGDQIKFVNEDFFRGLQKHEYAPKLLQRIKEISGL